MHKSRWFALFAILLLLPFTAIAQEDTPLILWVRGDLYAVTDSAIPPTPLTQNGTISGPALSSDGTMIAYKAAAPVGLEALSRVQTSGFIADFDLPGDIFVLNVPTQQTALVAGQPANASLLVEGVADNATVRSTPAWSPDGTALAWTEFAFGSTTARLVNYDLATRTETVLVETLPVPLALGAAPHVRWGEGGIAVITDEGGVLFYGADGTPLSTIVLTMTDDDTPQEYVWVEGDAPLFGVFYASGRWALFDPATGTEQPIDDVPVMVGKAENSLALRFGALPDVGILWETIDMAGTSGAFPATPSRVTLSPDGQQVAFIGYPDYGGVAVWQNGEVTSITGTGSSTLAAGAVLWGATTWRLGPAA